MRMTHGAIYLVEPLYGRSVLTGPAVIGPTWIEYTFNHGQDAASDGNDLREDDPPSGQQVLIPLTNVRAIVIADEIGEESGGRLLPLSTPAVKEGGDDRREQRS